MKKVRFLFCRKFFSVPCIDTAAYRTGNRSISFVNGDIRLIKLNTCTHTVPKKTDWNIGRISNGDYADAFRLATAAIDKFGWYNRNCAINPYLVEGKKTCAMEIAEQLAWNVPDKVFISVGDGCCIGGLYKGFGDLMELGLTERMPRIFGVQAEGSKPIYEAFKAGAEKVTFTRAATLADSIAVGSPRNWAKALRAVRRTDGDMLTVTDEEILSAIPELARSTGVFGEPAGATAFAGFRKAAQSGALSSGDRVAVVVTGNGLKDIANAQKSVPPALSVAPDLAELESKLGL